MYLHMQSYVALSTDFIYLNYLASVHLFQTTGWYEVFGIPENLLKLYWFQLFISSKQRQGKYYFNHFSSYLLGIFFSDALVDKPHPAYEATGEQVGIKVHCLVT